MPLHPAWVKNISRRVLWAALEKDITKEDRRSMQEHFLNRCAYCGNELGSRWHADHLLSVDKGGFNHISNRVPACAQCNEKEKREQDWREFLTFKCGGNSAVLKKRQAMIEGWKTTHVSADQPVADDLRALWREEADKVASAIDDAWMKLKKAKGG